MRPLPLATIMPKGDYAKTMPTLNYGKPQFTLARFLPDTGQTAENR